MIPVTLVFLLPAGASICEWVRLPAPPMPGDTFVHDNAKNGVLENWIVLSRCFRQVVPRTSLNPSGGHILEISLSRAPENK